MTDYRFSVVRFFFFFFGGIYELRSCDKRYFEIHGQEAL